jgi:hypothetical protein
MPVYVGGSNTIKKNNEEELPSVSSSLGSKYGNINPNSFNQSYPTYQEKAFDQTLTPFEKEQRDRARASEQYRTSIEKAQIQPGQLQANYDTYRTTQEKTNKDYANTMEKLLAENTAKNKELEAKYSERVDPMYDLIKNQQTNVQAAMDTARQKYEAEEADARNFFNTDIKGRFTSAMDKANADYAATKALVEQKMNATDAYYQNQLKPQYARLMEGGLSLREASDPSNYITQNVQSAYDKLIQKSKEESDLLTRNIKQQGQADYGVLNALGQQARSLTGSSPITGAQIQLQQAQQQNQASEAYQQAMKRLADIQSQQQQYAQKTRETGLTTGMNQAWTNYDKYGQAVQNAQAADINNLNAMLSGTAQLGNLTGQAAQTQFAGTQGLGSARSNLSNNINNLIGGAFQAQQSGSATLGNLGQQYTNLAGNQYNIQSALADKIMQNASIVPQFGYETTSGFNQGQYGVGQQMTDLGSKNLTSLANIDFAKQMENVTAGQNERIRQENIAMQQQAIDKQIAAAEAQAQAQKEGNFWGSVLGTIGTVGGGIAGGVLSGGNPMGVMAGAGLGGGVGRGMSGMFGLTGDQTQYQQPNYMQYASYLQPYQPTFAQTKTTMGTELSPYWNTGIQQTVGVSPTFQGNYGLGITTPSYQQPQYNLGINYGNQYNPYSPLLGRS